MTVQEVLDLAVEIDKMLLGLNYVERCAVLQMVRTVAEIEDARANKEELDSYMGARREPKASSE